MFPETDLIPDEWFIERKLSLIVLAGGKSRRMGRDKADLIYQNKTFLQWQIEKGKQLGISDILVSGYRGNRYQDCGAANQHGSQCQERMVMDRYQERGPLGGLEAAFRSAACEFCMVLTVDMPLIPVEELRRLTGEFRKASCRAMLMKHGGQEEPLTAIYRADLAEAAEQELLAGNGSVFTFLKRIGYEVYETSSPERYFLNINHPKEYQELM